MKFLAACVAMLLLAPATAQTVKPGTPDPARELAVQRCKENRGYNCDSEEGLREWLRQERPITKEEQEAAAGARRHREACAKNPKGKGC